MIMPVIVIAELFFYQIIMAGVAIVIRLSPRRLFSKLPCSLELIVVWGLLVNAVVYVCEAEGKPFFLLLF